MRFNEINKIQKSKGAALFASMMILILLTAIGLASMNSSVVELKIATNLQEKSIGFQSSQAGIDTVMCLTDTLDNPFDLKYELVEDVETDPSLKFQWDTVHDTGFPYYNRNPISGITDATSKTTCSIVSDGDAVSNISNTELAVATRQVARKIDCPREENASSFGKIKCNNYIIDSRYSYGASGASATTWAGLSRQVPGS
ncbi:MAG: hypothetical protein GY694_13270 [Gammaproteobacteria bacterium]|nr:hypothetical protein [Gammaproteobacteria bacterium]